MQLYKFIQILYNFGIGVMWAVLFVLIKCGFVIFEAKFVHNQVSFLEDF